MGRVSDARYVDLVSVKTISAKPRPIVSGSTTFVGSGGGVSLSGAPDMELLGVTSQGNVERCTVLNLLKRL